MAVERRVLIVPGAAGGAVRCTLTNTGPTCGTAPCRERGTSGRPQAELSCFRGSKALWSDLVNGLVVAACGTPNFAAVGLQDGSLLVSGPAGARRALLAGDASAEGAPQGFWCCT